MIVALAAAVVLLTWRRPALLERRHQPATGDVESVATLIVLGLDAGMNVSTALSWARRYAHPALAAELAAVDRRARLHGLSSGMRSTSGPLEGLLRSIALAVETGASLSPVLEAHRDQLAADSKAVAAARLRRLPIKLVFPLALLMLPGLVLMVAAPALIEALGRFA
ncbi:MAG: type II secretion system F family protein [bacterium]|nr:type II secretion system F family protein [bacterium]